MLFSCRESKRETLLSGLATDNITLFLPILEEVDWTPDAIKSFRNSTLNTHHAHICYTDLNTLVSYLMDGIVKLAL